MAINTMRWAVLLAAVLVAGAFIAFGLTHRATAQDNPNSQPSTSKYATDGSDGSIQAAATLKKVLWAVVSSDGTLARGKGALDANRLRGGQYEVLFDRNVSKCVYTATIGLSGASGFSAPGQITVGRRTGASNGVFITTHNSSGSFADRGFHLALNCPV